MVENFFLGKNHLDTNFWVICFRKNELYESTNFCIRFTLLTSKKLAKMYSEKAAEISIQHFLKIFNFYQHLNTKY